MADKLSKDDCIARVREHFSRPNAKLAYVIDEELEPGDEGYSLCVYRYDQNPTSPVRCALGVLIPDELYEPTMEKKTVYSLFEGEFSFLKDLFEPKVNVGWLGKLQHLHDSQVESVEVGTVEGFLEELDGALARGEL